jgi:hypothetical protein
MTVQHVVEGAGDRAFVYFPGVGKFNVLMRDFDIDKKSPADIEGQATYQVQGDLLDKFNKAFDLGILTPLVMSSELLKVNDKVGVARLDKPEVIRSAVVEVNHGKSIYSLTRFPGDPKMGYICGGNSGAPVLKYDNFGRFFSPTVYGFVHEARGIARSDSETQEANLRAICSGEIRATIVH